MASSIGEVSRRVHESNAIATGAVKQVENANAQVLELSNAAVRIGNIVKLITDIAARTNLLALNATIEAARSGAAGKGFAVVAQEVKALATQTAHATYEIDGQISGMQTVTEESVTTIKRISDTMTWISQISSSVATSMEEQGAPQHGKSLTMSRRPPRAQRRLQPISPTLAAPPMKPGRVLFRCSRRRARW
jgi:methyl-accepting chemotaxis protein